MSPITHLLVGWTALEHTQATRQGGTLTVFASIASARDCIGIVVDFATRQFGVSETNYCQTFHRLWNQEKASQPGREVYSARGYAAFECLNPRRAVRNANNVQCQAI